MVHKGTIESFRRFFERRYQYLVKCFHFSMKIQTMESRAVDNALAASQREATESANHCDRLAERCAKSDLCLVAKCLQRFKGECLFTAVIAHACRLLPCATFHSLGDEIALEMRARLVEFARSLGSAFEYRQAITGFLPLSFESEHPAGSDFDAELLAFSDPSTRTHTHTHTHKHTHH